MDNDKELQKVQERVLRLQKESAKRRERQSPSRISEAVEKCSIPRNEPVKDAEPIERCQRCGKTDCELITPAGGRYILLCLDCETERHQYIADQIREERRLKRDNIRQKIERIIPRSFQAARLHRLGQKFKCELLSYDRTTGLVLFGPTGVGKSWALAALLRTFIASGLKCERIGYEELCLQIRHCFKPQSVTTQLDILEKYRKVNVLVIEDLGSSKPIGITESDFSLSVIYSILDKRLEWQQQTLISTNKTLANLKASFDERIASRLSLMKWLGVGGRDKRSKA